MKILISTAIAALAAFTAGAHASYAPTDAAASGSNTHINGPRDPYTDGGNAGKFDVYSDGTKVAHRPDVLVNTSRSDRFDLYIDGTRIVAGRDLTGVSAPPDRGANSDAV